MRFNGKSRTFCAFKYMNKNVQLEEFGFPHIRTVQIKNFFSLLYEFVWIYLQYLTKECVME